MLEGTRAQPAFIPRVDEALCEACRRCTARGVCRSKAIVVLDPGETAFIDTSRCFGCQLCIPECPHGAIGLSRGEVVEV